ncbi:PilT/PilU family type 4a pilus ATPase [Candidatus Gracilibacteria bacterium]|nr:PilT/PilU family type 4a pilus ATPase [Candidatus Gracilibacteria bacterium]
MDFEQIVAYAEKQNASDIHFSPGLPIFLRITGQMIPLDDKPLESEKIQEILDPLLKPEHKEVLKNRRQVDFLAVTQVGLRLRGNAFFQEYGVSASFRIIPRNIRPSISLGFPKFVYDRFLHMKQGLVLIVGPTGEGKSTTLASMIQERANLQTEHIITVEDPVEYLLTSSKSMVQQREVGRDVLNFKDGIIAGLREDPDVLMVGEMRDLETISSVLTMAETGHTVFSTLHTNNGPETITRIIDVFPPEHQDQIRSQLATTLTMIISQRLLPAADGKSLILAYEILSTNYAIQNHIRQNKIYQIQNVLQTDSSGYMVQFEQSLAGLVINNKITKETAIEYAQDKDQLKSILIANGVK